MSFEILRVVCVRVKVFGIFLFLSFSLPIFLSFSLVMWKVLLWVVLRSYSFFGLVLLSALGRCRFFHRSLEGDVFFFPPSFFGDVLFSSFLLRVSDALFFPSWTDVVLLPFYSLYWICCSSPLSLDDDVHPSSFLWRGDTTCPKFLWGGSCSSLSPFGWSCFSLLVVNVAIRVSSLLSYDLILFSRRCLFYFLNLLFIIFHY